jgi:hypothetical protein
MDLLTKLSKISGLELDLLTQLNEIGIIAGGSIVASLIDCPFDDVDVFLFCTLKEASGRVGFSFGYNEGTVATFFRNGRKIQLIHNEQIFGRNPTPTSILERFDDDYCRCGIHKGEFYQTEECKEAISSMTIKEINGHDHRLKKALEKGFRIPYLTLIEKNLSFYGNDQYNFDFVKAFGSSSSDNYASLGTMKRSWLNPRFASFYDDEDGKISVNLEYDQYDKDGNLQKEQNWMATYPMEFTVLDVTEKKVPIVETELSNPFSLYPFDRVSRDILNKIKFGEKQVFAVFAMRQKPEDEDFGVRTDKEIEEQSKITIHICNVIEAKVWIPEYQTTLFDVPARLSQSSGHTGYVFDRERDVEYFYVYKGVQFVVKTFIGIEWELHLHPYKGETQHCTARFLRPKVVNEKETLSHEGLFRDFLPKICELIDT